MIKRKPGILLIILLSSLFFVQCARNSLETNSTDATSLFGMGFLFATSPITIQAGGLDYRTNGTYNFGTVTTGSTSQLITFSIQNTGNENILFPSPPVAVGGDNAADFTVTDPGITNLAPGATATFTVIFTPGGDGPRNGVITIMNSDNEVIYTLNLTGTGSATPVPDIYLETGGTYYASGSGYDFGSVSLGFSSSVITFTIGNSGQSSLALTGSPTVATGGADASDFTVSGPAGTAIAAGATDTFTVTFTPSSLGQCRATITVQSDDPDIGTYTINLTGTGIALPTISPVTIASNNANTSFARPGDTVTLSFTADVAIQTPTVTIAGNAAAVTGGPTSWTATYTMTAVDAEGTVPFVISNIMNLAGAPVADVTATTDGSGVTFDRTVPAGYTAAIDQAMINTANQAACSFTFNGAEIGTTYDFTITSSGGGTAVTGSGTVAAAGETITGIDVSGLGDGTLTLSVTLTDAAGNAGAAVTDTVTKDVAVPSGYSVSIDQAAINSGNVGAFSFTFAGAEVGATYNYTISSSGGGTNATGSGTVAAINETITGINVSGPNDGTLTLSVTLTDAAGNAGAAATDTVAKDAAVPSGYNVSIDQPYINNGNVGAFSFTFAGAEVGATYNYTISSSGGGTNATGSGMVTLANEIITGINVSGPNDGTLTLSVTLTDTGGNTGIAATDTVVKDVVVPTVSFTSTPAITAANASSYNVTGTCSDSGRMVIVSINGTPNVGPPCLGGTFSATAMDVSGEPDGTVVVTADHSDEAGNNAVQASSSVSKDALPPSGYSVSIDQAAINSGNVAAFSFTFAGAEVGATYNYTISSSGGGTNATGSGTVTAANENISGINVSGPNDGTLTLSVTLTDTGGNTGIAATDTVAKDAAAPSGYFVSFGPSAVNSLNVSNISFAFTGAEVGATYNYTISSSGGGTNATGSGTVTLANEVITGINASGPNDGTLTLSVTLTDTAGNAGTAATDTVDKDVVAPAGYSVFINPAYINSGNVAGFSFTFTGAETGTICNYTISSSGGGTNATGSVGIIDANQTISGIDVSGPSDGTLTLSVVLMDSLGNTGSAATDSVAKDVIAPTVAIGAPSPAVINNSGSADFGITYGGADTVNLTSPSVSLTTTGDAICAVSVADGTTSTPTVTLFSCSGNGTVRISIASGTSFDAAGNTNFAGGPGTPVTVDTLNPSLSFSSVGPINAANAGAYVVSGFCTEEGRAVNVTVGGSVSNSPVCTGGMYTTDDMDVSGISDGGSVSVAANHSDGAGNTENISTNVVKDTVIPTLTMSPVPGTITYANQNAYAVSGVCSEEGQMVTVTVIDDESSSVSQGPICSSGWYTTTLDVSGLSDGVGRLTITHTDGAGNTSQTGIDPLAKDTAYPAMNVRINGTSQPTSSMYSFGTVETGTTKAVTVDIYNTGTGTLILPISPVAFTGANFNEFTTADLESGAISINPGDMATFILNFTPTDVVNPRDALMSITSNDPNTPVYTITLQGNGSASNTPDINVKVNGLSLNPGGEFDFGTVSTGTTKTARVDVYNNGSANLTLPNAGPIWLTGVNPSEFLVNGAIKGPITIPAGGSFSFMASFAPTQALVRSAQLVITSDDPDVGSFVVTLLGTGTAATTQDISLKINNLEVANTGTFDFGQVLTTLSKTVAVEIANKGTADLTLSSSGGPVYLTGTNFPDWEHLTGAPGLGTVIAAGTSVTFTMDFIPPVDGLRFAQLRVLSDDPDTGTYVVNLKGSGSLAPVPDIDIELDGLPYSSASTFNFGAELVDTPISVNVDIFNGGSDILNISGGTVVSISGPDSADFAVIGSGAWPAPESVPAGSSLVISSGTGSTVEFTPSGPGVRRAQMTVVSDDPDTGTYVVNLQGIGVMPRVMVCGGGTSDTAIYNPMTGVFSAGNPTGGLTVNAGGHSFKMQDGSNRHVLIYGANPQWAIFDPTSKTFTTQSSFGTNANPGANSFPVIGGNYDKNYITLLANGTVTKRCTLSPSMVTYNTLSSIANGSFSFPIPSGGGQMMIIHGGFSTTLTVFDPLGNAGNGSFTTIGNTLTSGAQYGAHSIMIDALDSPYNGSVLVILGGGSNGVNLYSGGSFNNFGGKTLSGSAGDGASSVPILTGLHRGKWLIIHAGTSPGTPTTTLFNPLVDDATTFTPGPNLYNNYNASYGSFSFVVEHGPNAGLIVVVHGGSSFRTSVCDPKIEPLQFNAGPNLPNAGYQYTAGNGAHSFPLK